MPISVASGSGTVSGPTRLDLLGFRILLDLDLQHCCYLTRVNNIIRTKNFADKINEKTTYSSNLVWSAKEKNTSQQN
jgi:hypothetical protein